jgi:hypothetical protein
MNGPAIAMIAAIIAAIAAVHAAFFALRAMRICSSMEAFFRRSDSSAEARSIASIHRRAGSL